MSKKTVGGIYHVLNRGVDKRKIFMDDNDYLRFIHDLFEFNDENPAFNVGHNFKNQYIDVGRQYIESRKPRKFLVEILAFCLMPNHYHLLLRAKRENGLENFIKKINGGYAKYFNNKYKRSGALFQGKYKSVLVKDESHFIHLPYYIHLNPLDLVAPEWRERNILTSDVNKIVKFLEGYRWSSYLDYIGKKNFPSVTQREFLNEFFGGPEQYRKDTIKWLREMDWEAIKDVVLEN
jgi:putative transposase